MALSTCRRWGRYVDEKPADEGQTFGTRSAVGDISRGNAAAKCLLYRRGSQRMMDRRFGTLSASKIS